jgi:ubiquinone biosynthesis protein UbiJ
MMTPSVSALDSIKPLAGRVLQEALNRALRLDPASMAKLQALDGRRIEVHMQSPDFALAIDVNAGVLQVGPVDAQREADISFKSRLSGLLQSLPMFSQGRTPVGAMRISGDVELARLMQDLVKAYDPDWQAPFVRAFGPVLGPQAAKFLASALRQGRVAAENLARSGAEYVTEEARVVVSKAELQEFNNDVDRLRQHADRLQARADRLRTRLS